MEALAIKYRPKTWDDVTEQNSIKIILSQQLESGELQHCYLFVGSAGTGKTTSARIFANEINKGQGNPIELDAASNNSVDDMRDLIQQAKTKSLDSEYKVFIIDECHMITIQGWNAVLKLIEEPPAKSIFIFCTTDPQKIPKTIISRVQRYDFQRISQQGIVDRLKKILSLEFDGTFGCIYCKQKHWDQAVNAYTCDVHGYYADKKVCPDADKSFNFSNDAIEYIAKIADGGMRDAITMLDKCLAYSKELTLENVVKILGVADYDTMFDLTDALVLDRDNKKMIEIVEELHTTGKDLKQFIRNYIHFVLDIRKVLIDCPAKYISIPDTAEYRKRVAEYKNVEFDEYICSLLNTLISLNSDIKYSTSPKIDIEAALMM